MIRQTLKQSAVALCAAAMAALVPLASAGSASAQTRPQPAVHGSAAPTHQAMVRTGGRWMNAGATFRGRHFVSTRRFVVANRSVVVNRSFGVRRFGWRGPFWRRRFVGVAGYPYYAYGYGYRPHSCWWYRRFDPWHMPSWCGAYGYSYGFSYGYGPSYAYGYGPAWGWRHRYGTFVHRRFAFGGVSVRSTRQFGVGGFAARSTRQFAFGGARARPMEGRAALVGQGGVRFQSGGPRNFGAGGAHFGGGAHMGGAAHVSAPGGGHVIQH